MKYDEAIEYMDSLNTRGIHPGLEGVRLLCEAFDNPQDKLKFIHVTGTNGKGSTSKFIAEILRASGLCVGLYSSPAVFSEREILLVNGRPVTKDKYAEYVALLKEKNTFGCTRFEVETVMAFLHFLESACDMVVLEVGLGGLLDATNIIKDSCVSVFTAIGMDHTGFLGDSVSKIAANKAGIIKKNSFVISTNQPEDALNVIKNRTKETASTFVFSDAAAIKKVKFKKEVTSFSYAGYSDLEITLPGSFQVQNACLAIDTCLTLRKAGFFITEKDIRKGLKNCKMPGRFERILDKPVFIIDGAHNEPASLKLRESLGTYFTKKKIIYIMGMLKDKDVETVVKNTVDIADCIFTVATPKKERTMSAFELADIVRQYNQMVTSLDSVEEAVEMALMMADANTVIVAFGSLSHLKLVKEAVKNISMQNRDTHGVKR